jgi:hypothetical protein
MHCSFLDKAIKDHLQLCRPPLHRKEAHGNLPPATLRMVLAPGRKKLCRPGDSPVGPRPADSATKTERRSASRGDSRAITGNLRRSGVLVSLVDPTLVQSAHEVSVKASCKPTLSRVHLMLSMEMVSLLNSAWLPAEAVPMHCRDPQPLVWGWPPKKKSMPNFSPPPHSLRT